jgi:predicted AlkP superfamily phosphohydrolase/phosphomutase
VNDSGDRVLAIGLDGAQPTLLQRMLADGELPAMEKLLAGGSWSAVSAPSHYSSGAVWPTFFTGSDPSEHGRYAHWGWDPGSMGLTYYDASVHTPFWQALDAQGLAVGIVDVPFAPHLGVQRGFEVLEWGAHDRVDGKPTFSPPHIAETASGQHPFAHPLTAPPEEPAALSRLSAECLEGARLRGDLAVRLLTEERPDLAIVVFPEVHRGGHFLWHTAEPEAPMYADLRDAPRPENDVGELYRELDRQVARLVEAAGEGTAVIVFGLHGMEPGRGVPPVLEPLLAGMGLAHLDDATGRRRALVNGLKKRLPAALRNAYRSSVPLATRSQWGKASLLPAYDWSRTRAFSLPTDQHGWVRVNLAGRERDGVVAPAEYGPLLDSIEAEVRSLRTTAGHPVVADVVRPPRSAGADPLPDLIVHWTAEAFEGPTPVHGADTVPIRRNETGRHATGGFCIVHGTALTGAVGDTVRAEDLHRLLLTALNR